MYVYLKMNEVFEDLYFVNDFAFDMGYFGLGKMIVEPHKKSNLR